MSSSAKARILSWVNRTPAGPVYVAFVLIKDGLFIADQLDAEHAAKLKSAVATDTTTVIAFLSQLDDRLRPAFVRWHQIDHIRPGPSGDSIEIVGAGKVISLEMTDSERLDKVAELLSSVHQARSKALITPE